MDLGDIITKSAYFINSDAGNVILTIMGVGSLMIYLHMGEEKDMEEEKKEHMEKVDKNG